MVDLYNQVREHLCVGVQAPLDVERARLEHFQPGCGSLGIAYTTPMNLKTRFRLLGLFFGHCTLFIRGSFTIHLIGHMSARRYSPNFYPFVQVFIETSSSLAHSRKLLLKPMTYLKGGWRRLSAIQCEADDSMLGRG